MSILRELLNGGADLARIGAAAAARKEIEAKYRARAKQAAKDGTEGCTPCAAKKRAVEYYNKVDATIWK